MVNLEVIQKNPPHLCNPKLDNTILHKAHNKDPCKKLDLFGFISYFVLPTRSVANKVEAIKIYCISVTHIGGW